MEEPPNDQIGQLLSGFIELRKEVLKQQGEVNTFLIRRLRAGDNLHAFNRVGNKRAFQFYEAVAGPHSGCAGMHERKNDKGYEKATQEMEAGEIILLNRQKMIKLADRSKLGWSVGRRIRSR